MEEEKFVKVRDMKLPIKKFNSLSLREQTGA